MKKINEEIIPSLKDYSVREVAGMFQSIQREIDQVVNYYGFSQWNTIQSIVDKYLDEIVYELEQMKL